MKIKYSLKYTILLLIFIFFVAIMVLVHKHQFFAMAEEQGTEVIITSCSVSGEEIDADAAYYIQWSCKSLITEFDGTNQKPTATLKKVDDDEFSVLLDTESNEECVDAGDYTVTALKIGYEFTLGNQIEITITQKFVEVLWNEGNEKNYTYDGTSQGPTASFKNVNEETISLKVSGWGINAGRYTAVASLDSAEKNYKLSNSEYKYSIDQASSAVYWKVEFYIYNGKSQGPTASYKNIDDEVIPLVVNGYGANAGNYIAKVASDTVGENYSLTNNECNYTIGKANAVVFWEEEDEYIENGKHQGPRAYIIGVNQEKIELPVLGYGSAEGSFTARIDEARCPQNYGYGGDTSRVYTIKAVSILQANNDGLVGSIVLSILLFICIVVLCFLFIPSHARTTFMGKIGYADKGQVEQKEKEINRLNSEIMQLRKEQLRISMRTEDRLNSDLGSQRKRLEETLELNKQLSMENEKLKKKLHESSKEMLKSKKPKEMPLPLKSDLEIYWERVGIESYHKLQQLEQIFIRESDTVDNAVYRSHVKLVYDMISDYLKIINRNLPRQDR